MPAPRTAPERLELLLPWLNGDELDPEDIRGRLWKFTQSFDGSASASYLQVVPGAGERELAPVRWQRKTVLTLLPERLRGSWMKRSRRAIPPPISKQKLEQLRQRVVAILLKGFPPGPDELKVLNALSEGKELRRDQLLGVIGDRTEVLSGLQFGVRGGTRQRPDKFPRPSRRETREYNGPGAFVTLVGGPVAALVPFLVVRLLAAQGMALSRCPARVPYTRDERCGKFAIYGGRGRPDIYCSDSCKTLASEDAKKQQTGIKPRKGRPPSRSGHGRDYGFEGRR